MSDSDTRNGLEQRLRRAEAAKAGSYDKRTEHLNPDGSGRFINRLILEDSPYLLQHAHNPVDWYPWGGEAFARAREENKPVFLSIGYSTCHWCHVMEVESFDNVEVAKRLNRHFVSIKMDREQYPDIDEIYMTGVQLMSGQGGWPMSNFLLPDGRPFFAATYFPPPAFLKLLERVAAAWEEKYAELEQSAASVDAAIKRILGEHKPASLDGEVGHGCVQALLKREDRRHGGLAGAPKFPQEPLLLFLLDRVVHYEDAGSLDFVTRALHGMAEGGIHDQVGGGFHRYSVDPYWLVPHFEKMLYNQSQLVLVYLQAFRITREPFFRRVIEQTLDYICRDLQHPGGGFYSATDADSEGAEGTFFLWTPLELRELLGSREYALATELFDISEGGNFEGANILSLKRPLSEAAAAHGGTELYKDLDRIREKLYRAREQRVHPLRDDKLIVAWNGTMIHALAQAAQVLGNKDWLAAAERAAAYLIEHNVDQDGRLTRICLGGTASIAGQLEDYANFCQGLLSLYDVAGNQEYLELATRLMTQCLAQFHDPDHGSFFLSPRDQPGPQLIRSRSAADGATLSPVATAIDCLQRLQERAALLDGSPGELYYREIIDRALTGQHGAIADNPLSHTSLLRNLEHGSHGGLEVIRFACGGLVRVTASRRDGDNAVGVTVTLNIAPGWHLTAANQVLDQAVPMEIAPVAGSSWIVEEVTWSEARTGIEIGQDERLGVYEGEAVIGLRLRPPDSDGPLAHLLKLDLTLQPCDDKHCLLPETLTVVV